MSQTDGSQHGLTIFLIRGRIQGADRIHSNAFAIGAVVCLANAVRFKRVSCYGVANAFRLQQTVHKSLKSVNMQVLSI